MGFIPPLLIAARCFPSSSSISFFLSLSHTHMLGPDVPRILSGTSGMASQTWSWFTPTNPPGPSQPPSLHGAVPAPLPGLGWRGRSSSPPMKLLAEPGGISLFFTQRLRRTELHLVCAAVSQRIGRGRFFVHPPSEFSPKHFFGGGWKLRLKGMKGVSCPLTHQQKS